MVKNNQKSLRQDIGYAFTFATNIRSYEEKQTRSHGRIEQRSIDVIDMPWEYDNAWDTIKQVARITRISQRKKGKTTKEELYLISSLSKKDADPEKLLSLNRSHWSVENTQHWVRDTIFGEDQSTLRKGNTPRTNATLNSLAIAILKKTKSDSIKAARETFAHYTKRAIKLIC